MTFGKEFTNAVEQKQIAQQEAERAKFIVEKVNYLFIIINMFIIQLNTFGINFIQAEQEKQASVIRAEGEAEAAERISKALDKAGEGLILLRRIEASKEIAATLSGSRNITYLPSSHGGGSNLLLNLGL